MPRYQCLIYVVSMKTVGICDLLEIMSKACTRLAQEKVNIGPYSEKQQPSWISCLEKKCTFKYCLFVIIITKTVCCVHSVKYICKFKYFYTFLFKKYYFIYIHVYFWWKYPWSILHNVLQCIFLSNNMTFYTNLCATCNSLLRFLFTVYNKTMYTYSTRRTRLARIW